MTKTQPTPLDTFLSCLREAHPALLVTCDLPTTSTGSTWIDVRSGGDWLVIEHHPDLGFGFAEPSIAGNDLYGTPSAVFVRDVAQALERAEDALHAMAAGPAASAT